MTPQDIQVGNRYRNNTFPSDVWLGIGKRVMWEGNYGNTDSNFHFKHLVLIDSDYINQIGLIAQEGDDATAEFWDNFELIDTPN